MNAVMRRVVRRTSLGLGALALAAGAAACGGDNGEQQAPEQDPAIQEPAAQDEGDLEPSDGDGQQSAKEGEGAEAPDASDGDEGGENDEDDEGEESGSSTEEVTTEQIDAATQRWVEFMQAVVDGDGEMACQYMINPETGETGDEDPECAQAFEEEVMSQVDGDAYGEFDASLVAAEDNGDGTVTIMLEGRPFPMVMTPGDDGAWYLAPTL